MLVTLGDLISQKLIEKQAFDVKRSVRATIIGATTISLSLYAWYYKFLPYLFAQFPASSLLNRYSALSITVLDQALFAPYLTVAYLFTINYLEFFNIAQATENVRKLFFIILIGNYSFWPFVNYLNFKFIPFDYRMLGINLCSITWNTFLAYRNQKNKVMNKTQAVSQAVKPIVQKGV